MDVKKDYTCIKCGAVIEITQPLHKRENEELSCLWCGYDMGEFDSYDDFPAPKKLIKKGNIKYKK